MNYANPVKPIATLRTTTQSSSPSGVDILPKPPTGPLRCSAPWLWGYRLSGYLFGRP